MYLHMYVHCIITKYSDVTCYLLTFCVGHVIACHGVCLFFTLLINSFNFVFLKVKSYIFLVSWFYQVFNKSISHFLVIN